MMFGIENFANACHPRTLMLSNTRKDQVRYILIEYLTDIDRFQHMGGISYERRMKN